MLKSNGGKIFDVFNYVIMVLFCITIIFPFWDIFILSFTGADESMTLGFRLWPKMWRLDAYEFAFSDDKILWAYAVTILRTISGVVLHVVVTLLAAYPLAKRDLPFRNQITLYFLIPMFFSGGLIPSYLINKQLHLQNNFLVYILPLAVATYTVVLVRNFIMSIDPGLEESAIIDGAGQLTILTYIIIPVSKPIIATITLWSIVNHWNAWMDNLIYCSDERLTVLQMVLRRMIENMKLMSEQAIERAIDDPARNIAAKNIQAAVTLITIGPIVLSYPFLQKYFVKGIMVGSLKG